MMTTPELQLKNCRILLAFMEGLSEEEVNLDGWYADNGDPDDRCGTVACVGGWATTIKAFRDQGLRRYNEGRGRGSVCRLTEPELRLEAGRVLSCWDAAERLFGARRVFDVADENSPLTHKEQALQRIRDQIKALEQKIG